MVNLLVSEDNNLEGRLDSDRGERLKSLDAPHRERFFSIYNICDSEFGGDLDEMRDAYVRLSVERTTDREVYKAWVRDITRLHRLECLFGRSVVRAYVEPAKPEGNPIVEF